MSKLVWQDNDPKLALSEPIFGQTKPGIVLLLRHDEKDYNDVMLQMVWSEFGSDVQFRRIDPKNRQEHEKECSRSHVIGVVLKPGVPLVEEASITYGAIQSGATHVAFVGGQHGLRLGRIKSFIADMDYAPRKGRGP